MLKLQSPSKYSPCDAIHLSRFFSTTQNSFWTHQFWCLLVLLPFFVSPLSHQQNVSLWGPFYPVALGKIRCIRRVGHRICLFLVKNRWTLGAVWSGALVNHPSWNGQLGWVFKKNLLKPNSAFHDNASWSTDTEGFLELSPSTSGLYYKGLTLQKIIPFCGVPPLYTQWNTIQP